MPYTVTRQRQYPGGKPVVEISAGGLDYTNPDALTKKFSGEFETFLDPRDAAEAAIAICNAWRKDGASKAAVAHGATGGMTMPFATCTYKELRAWADRVYAGLPKCDRCGELLPEKYFTVPGLDDERFCRGFCADLAYADAFRVARPGPRGPSIGRRHVGWAGAIHRQIKEELWDIHTTGAMLWTWTAGSCSPPWRMLQRS